MDPLLRLLLMLVTIAIGPMWAMTVSPELFWIVLAVESLALITLTYHFWRTNPTAGSKARILSSIAGAVGIIVLVNMSLNMLAYMATDGT